MNVLLIVVPSLYVFAIPYTSCILLFSLYGWMCYMSKDRLYVKQFSRKWEKESWLMINTDMALKLLNG